MENKICFVGVLSNVDKSILQMKLDHGFVIDMMSIEDGLRFFEELEGIPTQFPGLNALSSIFTNYSCLSYNEDRIYIVRNSIPYTPNPNSFDRSAEEKAQHDFHYGLAEDYLIRIFRLMRLFKEGDIRMPFEYYYRGENGRRQSQGKFFRYRNTSHELYQVSSLEMQELERFVRDTRIPFTEPSLQLALELLELSYDIDDLRLSFLALMVGLETLLNPSSQEITHRVSRNAAVLLWESKEGSKKVFDNIKELYDKRSRIVHSGKSGDLTRDDLLELRHYLRESIKKMHSINKGRDVILDLLNCQGYGQGVQEQ